MDPNVHGIKSLDTAPARRILSFVHRLASAALVLVLTACGDTTRLPGAELALDAGVEADPEAVETLEDATAVVDADEASFDAAAVEDEDATGEDSAADTSTELPLDALSLPPPCACESDADCAPGDRCSFWHVCKPMNLAPGQCWDWDCPMGSECAGMVVCACDGACFEPDHPGTCVSLGPKCCTSSTMCPPSEECTVGAVCRPRYDPPACWTHAECPAGFRCQDANVCPCGYACFVGDYEGTCVPLADGCCAKDADCPSGEVCAVLPNGVNGRCAPAPAAGACFTGVGCPGGACSGALLSTCVQPLPGLPLPGTCESGP